MRSSGYILSIGINKKTPTLSAPKNDGAYTILCLGASTTAPTWGKDHSWPRQLEQILNETYSPGVFTVINKGTDGATSDAIEANLPAYLDKYKPQAVVAMMGFSDSQWNGIVPTKYSLAGKTQKFLRSLMTYKLLLYFYHELFPHAPTGEQNRISKTHQEKIVELVQKRQIPLFLMQYPGLDLKALRDFFDNHSGIFFIDNKESFEAALSHGKYDDYFRDSFAGHWGHCTFKGDRLIAQNVARALMGSVLKNGAQIYDQAASKTKIKDNVTGTAKTTSDDLEFLHKMLGVKLNAPREALVYAERAVLLAAPNPSAAVRAAAYLDLAHVHEKLGDAAREEEALKRALEADPYYLAALHMMVELKKNNPLQAAVYARRAVAALKDTFPPARVVAFLDLARIHLTLKDNARAEENIESVLKTDPDNLDALHMMIDLNQNKPQAASLYSDRAVLAIQRKPSWARVPAYLDLAQIHLRLKNNARAEEALSRALAEDSANLAVLRKMIALKQDRPHEGLPYADRLVQAVENSSPQVRVEAYLNRAQILLRLKNNARAEADLKQALDAEPDNLRALSLLIDLKQDNPRESLDYAERKARAVRNSPDRDRAAAYLDLARTHLQLKDYPLAEENVKRALKADPNNLNALFLIVSLKQDHPREALIYAERAVLAAQNSPDQNRSAAYLNLAQIHLRLKDNARAENDLKLALAADPGSLNALHLMVDLKQNNPEEALVYAKQAAVLSVHNPSPRVRATAYLDLARTHLRLKNIAQAEEEAKSALETDPHNLEALRISVQLKDGRPQEQLALLRRPLPSDSSARIQWLTFRAFIRFTLKDSANAKNDIQEAIKISPSLVCLEKTQLVETSLMEPTYFDLCLNHYPRNPTLFLDRGVALYLRGNKRDAIADFRKAIALKPHYLEASISLATILAEEGNIKEALQISTEGISRSKGREREEVYRQLLSFKTSLLAKQREK